MGGIKNTSLQPIGSKQSQVTSYAKYLELIYANSQVTYDKWPYTPSKIYIKLALIKKEKVSRATADAFTRLTLMGDIDQILKVKQPIAMDDILRPGDRARLVVVEGAPGIGKSTFAWELCRQWRVLESLKRFSLVVFVRLREERAQKADRLSHLFYHRNSKLSVAVGQEVEKVEGDGLLIVIDGYDEFPVHLREASLIKDLISGLYLPGATIMVTSRPSATTELLCTCRRTVDKHIEVVGFSEKEISEYAESILKSQPTVLRNFFTFLSVNPVVRGMMYNPLNSAIIIEVYRETFLSGRPIPQTQTQLYTELTLYLLSRYLETQKDPLARKLPNTLGEIPRQVYDQLCRLGKLAYEERLKESVIFNRLPDQCSDLGLLSKTVDLYGRRETVTYNFLHLTLQEYMSAFFISQLAMAKQKSLFSESYSLKHMNMVWKFMAGLTQMKAIGWDGFKQGKSKNFDYSSKPKKWKDEEDDRGYAVKGNTVEVGPSIIQCLYEAQDGDSCADVFGSSIVKYYGDGCSRVLDAYSVGYCVAMSKNAWNVDLHMNSLGQELIEMLKCGVESTKSGGSIKWLDLSNNELRDEGLRHLQSLPKSFQCIKVLNLSYCQFGSQGFDIIACAIKFLPELMELKVSGNRGSTVRMFEALARHAKLLDLDVCETGLGRNDVAALSKFVQASKKLTELTVGDYDMTPECVEDLVRAIFTPSSVQELRVAVPYLVKPLNFVENISSNLITLGFFTTIPPPPSTSALTSPEAVTVDAQRESSSNVESSAFSNALQENDTLESLFLDIPLDKPVVLGIVASLRQNSTITELWLSEHHHYRFFSKPERQELDTRIEWWY